LANALHKQFGVMTGMRFVKKTILVFPLLWVVFVAKTWAACGDPVGQSHPTNEAMHIEHEAILAYFDCSEVTHRSVQSGLWSDPATWEGGRVPSSPDDFVLISSHTDVTLDVDGANTERTRVDGTMRWATNKSITFKVNTFFVDPSGHLLIGSAQSPIPASLVDRVVITDRGLINTVKDPYALSHGFISHGEVRIFGTRKTAFRKIWKEIKKGDTSFDVDEAPVGWQAGDTLRFPGALSNPTAQSLVQSEALVIGSINNKTVTLQTPFAFAHVLLDARFPIPVGNQTRNIRFESEYTGEDPANLGRRGHVMFMHSPNITLQGVGFYNLGRTVYDDDDTQGLHITDPQVDENGVLVPGTDANVRGRYSLHFHRTGTDPNGVIPQILDCAVVGHTTGWGMVIHASCVHVDGAAVFDLDAGIVTEIGNEITTIENSVAGDTTGNGFLMHSGGALIKNCVGFQNHRDSLFVTRYISGEPAPLFPVAYMPPEDRTLFPGKDAVDFGEVPIHVDGFYSYVAGEGIGFLFWHGGHHNILNNVTLVYHARALSTTYSSGYTLQNSLLVPNRPPYGISNNLAVNYTDWQNDVQYLDSRIEGYNRGVQAPNWGTMLVRNCTFQNLFSIVVWPIAVGAAADQHREIRLENCTYLDLDGTEKAYEPLKARVAYEAENGNSSNGFIKGLGQLNIADQFMDSTFTEKLRDGTEIQIYPRYAAGDWRYPSTSLLFAGQTVQEVFDQHGLAPAGYVAPPDSVADPRYSNCLVSPPQKQRNFVTLNSAEYPPANKSYKFIPADHSTMPLTTFPRTLTLTPGFNILEFNDLSGAKRSSILYAMPTGRMSTLLSPKDGDVIASDSVTLLYQTLNNNDPAWPPAYRLDGGSTVRVGNSGQYTITDLKPGVHTLSFFVIGADLSGPGEVNPLTISFTIAPPTGNPAPTLTSIVPAQASREGGDLVTLTGTGFLPGARVTLAGKAATNITVVSPTSITATVPPNFDAAPALVSDARVVNFDGKEAKLTGGFTYLALPAPTIASVTPNEGSVYGGNTVTIKGAHLGHTSAITFWRTPSVAFKIVDDQTVTCVVPNHLVGTYDLTVRTTALNATLTNGYTFTAPPTMTISRLDPGSGPTSGGNKVLIRGANFTPLSNIYFGSNRASSIVYLNPTLLSLIAPPNGVGPVDVKTLNMDTEVSTVNSGYTYYPDGNSSGPGFGGDVDDDASTIAMPGKGQPARIDFTLAQSGHVRVKILTRFGNPVAMVADDDYPAGKQEVLWNGTDGSRADLLSSGLYIATIEISGQKNLRKKILLVK
jgi:hypothetical protein